MPRTRRAGTLAAVSTLLQTTNLTAAIIYLLITGMVVVELRRLDIGFPRVTLVLLSYFLMRVADLLAAPDPLLGYDPVLDAVTDIAVILLLVVLLANARRLARASLAMVNEAKLRVAEYERARRDYSVAVHAKVAGPLSVISGAAQALRETPDDPGARQHLSSLIDEAAEALRTVSRELEQVRGGVGGDAGAADRH